MSQTEIYVLRHGQTDWNRRGALQGQLDTPLNDAGLAQAAQAARQLTGLSFDAIYTSPLRRARDTARIACGASRTAIVPDARLLEIGFGVWEGKEIASLHPAVDAFLCASEGYVPPAGGETFASLLARANSFLLDAAARCPNGKVLAVSHGALMHAMLLCRDSRPLSTFWQPVFGNCAILKFSGSALRGELLFEGLSVR